MSAPSTSSSRPSRASPTGSTSSVTSPWASSGARCATLGGYLDAESSIAEIAPVLGVHRDTVAARVAGIPQLLAVDLRDPEQRLALHLARRTVGVAGDGRV